MKTKALKEIEEKIILTATYIRTEYICQRTEHLCFEYEYAKEQQKESNQTHKQLIKELIDCINDYINYPTTKILFIKRQNKATYRINKGWHGEFEGYNIKIPFVDKQEYYCVKNLLDNCKYIHQYIRQEWWLYPFND